MLMGTMLLDYQNEEEAEAMLSPRSAMELKSVGEWDGKKACDSTQSTYL